MMDTQLLKQYASDIGVALDTTALLNFTRYAEILLQTNQYMNLTAITEENEVLVKHFVDSLELLRFADLPQGASVIDVGTGAGFPGIPLLIARPDLDVTLLDSLQKRLGFLQTVLEACDLQAQTVHARAEDAGQDKCLRETFDIATARAVAPLNILAEYTLPFVKPGGCLWALKGMGEGIDDSAQAIATLGGEIVRREVYELPNGDKRLIVCVKKLSQTPTQYPRKPKKIATKPL